MTLVVASSAASGPGGFAASPLTPDTTFEGAKSSTGYLAKTDPTLLGKTSSAPVNVILKYDFDSTASYTGGVDGLAATSPSATGKSLKRNHGAVAAYEAYTGAVAGRISADVEKAVPSAKVTATFQTVYGGAAATVPADSISTLLSLDGVVEIGRAHV